MSHLQVADSSVVMVRLVEVVPESRVPEGPALERTGAVLSTVTVIDEEVA